MSSTFGRRHNLPGYDAFHTGIDFATARRMLISPSENPDDWPEVTRHTVLGRLHEMKEALYDQAVAQGYLGKREGKRRRGKGKGPRAARATRQQPQVIIIVDPDDVVPF